MSLTTGFLLLFFTIVVPGFLFLRFYYFGEFSKQFNPRENITRQLLFALIPGAIIQLICFLLGKWVGWITLDSSNILSFFETLNTQKFHKDHEAQALVANPVNFGYYLLIVYFLSFLAGSLITRVIRSFKWDKSLKILRYKNHWYYVFSGEIFEFKKFKSAANILGKPSLKDKEIQLSKVDILLNNGGEPEFYTGYVVDYDLSITDPTKLENLYLMDAYRYKRHEIINGDVNLVHPVITEKKHIPGEIFVLNTTNASNINVSYLLSEKKQHPPKWRNRILMTLNVIAVILLLGSVISIVTEIKQIPFKWYHDFHASSWWLDKVFAILICISVISLVITEKNDDSGKYEYSNKEDTAVNLIAAVLANILFWITYYFF